MLRYSFEVQYFIILCDNIGWRLCIKEVKNANKKLIRNYNIISETTLLGKNADFQLVFVNVTSEIICTASNHWTASSLSEKMCYWQGQLIYRYIFVVLDFIPKYWWQNPPLPTPPPHIILLNNMVLPVFYLYYIFKILVHVPKQNLLLS